MEHTKELIKAAVNHKGFSLVDILQPCVTFNKINTYEWYKQRVYHLESGYDPEDKMQAFQKALEWGERIPLGIIFRNNRPVLEERIPVIRDKSLVQQSFEPSKLEKTLKEFY